MTTLTHDFRPEDRDAVARPPLLRRVLLADALACLGAGAVTLVGSAWLAPHLGLPAALLAGAGALLLPVAALIAVVATRDPVPAGGLRAIVAINLLWVAASLGLFLVPGIDPTLLGAAFILAQAILVAAFAAIEARLALT